MHRAIGLFYALINSCLTLNQGPHGAATFAQAFGIGGIFTVPFTTFYWYRIIRFIIGVLKGTRDKDLIQVTRLCDVVSSRPTPSRGGTVSTPTCQLV